MHSMIFVTGVYLIGQVSGLVDNFNISIFCFVVLDTMNVINVKLCIVVLFIEHYLFMPLTLTLTLFQGHSNAEQL